MSACCLLAGLMVAGYLSSDLPKAICDDPRDVSGVTLDHGHVVFYFGRLANSMFVVYPVNLLRILVFCVAVTVLLWIDKGYWLARLCATSWFSRLAFLSVMVFGLSHLLWCRHGLLFQTYGTISGCRYLGVRIGAIHTYSDSYIFVYLEWPLLLTLTLLSGIAPTWWLVRRKQRRGEPFQS